MSFMLQRGARLAAGLVAALVACASQAASTNMVKNPSFEKPDNVEDGLYGGGGDDWIGSQFGPRLIRGNIQDQNGNFYGATPFGKQYLALGGISPTGFLASDAQDIDGFVAGKKYHLTIRAADLDGTTTPVLHATISGGADGPGYYSRKVTLPVKGPYGTTIKFTTLQATFVSPVTGMLRLTIENPRFPDPGQSPSIIAVDQVSIVPAAADAVVDWVPAQH